MRNVQTVTLLCFYPDMQGTVSVDRSLASHHIYPSLSSTEEGGQKHVHVMTKYFTVRPEFYLNYLHFQRNGFGLSCENKTRSWCIGAGTLTGIIREVHVWPYIRFSNKNIPRFFFLPSIFLVMKPGCPRVMSVEMLRSLLSQRNRGGWAHIRFSEQTLASRLSRFTFTIDGVMFMCPCDLGPRRLCSGHGRFQWVDERRRLLCEWRERARYFSTAHTHTRRPGLLFLRRPERIFFGTENKVSLHFTSSVSGCEVHALQKEKTLSFSLVLWS